LTKQIEIGIPFFIILLIKNHIFFMSHTASHANTVIKCLVWVWACLCLLPPPSLQAQTGLTDRENPSFRLNLLRSDVVTPHGQQPPFGWSAVYLRSTASNIQPEGTFLLDSSTCGIGIVNTNQFGEEVRITYDYDTDGQLQSIVFRKETTPGRYENFSRKQYTYGNRSRTNYLYQLWDSNSASWKDDYEESTVYNTDGKQMSFRVRETDGSGQWINLFRETRNYDSNGHVNEVHSAKWTNNAWQDTARREIQYNAVGFYTTIYEESWNGSGWDTLTRERASYGDLDMIWENYVLERKTPNGFEGVVREAYDYDDYGFWVSMTRQAWDGNTAQWELALRENYTYNRTGLWTSWRQQVYQDTGWVNTERQYFKKTGNLREDIKQNWDTTTNAWNNDSRMVANFDSLYNLVREAGV
jgi:hypothetical protein